MDFITRKKKSYRTVFKFIFCFTCTCVIPVTTGKVFPKKNLSINIRILVEITVHWSCCQRGLLCNVKFIMFACTAHVAKLKQIGPTRK
jgi:hypothetical protein